MKLRLLLVCMATIVFSFCTDEEKPALPKDTMVNILVDVHVAEAALIGLAEQHKDSLAEVYYQQIYEIHGVSEESFSREMDYIKRHPEYMDDLYTLVLEELAKREAALQ